MITLHPATKLYQAAALAERMGCRLRAVWTNGRCKIIMKKGDAK